MHPTQSKATLARAREVDVHCSHFESEWLSGRNVSLEEVLGTAPEALRAELFQALLSVELELLSRDGKQLTETQCRARFPDHADGVAAVFAELARQRSNEETSVSVKASAETGSDFRVHVASKDMATMPAEIGRYRILQVLGQGAFGTVYRARDPRLDREVALKVPRQGVLTTEQDTERFLREARATAALHHPNICPIYEVGEVEGRYFLVMGLVPGQSLAQFLDQCREPLPQKQAALLVAKLALALEAAHAKGVIHRDLKPSNIMLDMERQEPTITDFGMARRINSDDAQLTQSGVVMGTPAYMSPEQAAGATRDVGPGCDVFALGVILYELLAGKRPFSGSVTEVLGQILYASIEPPSRYRSGLNPQLEAICLKAMARDVRDRYGTMKEFAAALTKAVKASENRPNQAASSETHDDNPEQSELTTLFDAMQAQGTIPATGTSSLSHARGGRSRRFSLMIAGGLAGAVLLFAGILFFARTPTATVLINVDVDLTDKSLSYFLDRSEWSAAKLAGPVELEIGGHELVVMRGQAEFGRYRFVVLGGRDPGIQITESRPPASRRQEEVGDIDRRAAEWVLSVEGKIRIHIAGRDQEITAARDLPTSLFQVVSIDLAQNPRVTNADLSKLAALTGLKQLDLGETNVTDLSPLAGMNLTSLSFAGTSVSDLSPLTGMKLTWLFCAGTKVSDLSPLAGMKLTSLYCAGTPISSLSALKGMPLTYLNAHAMPISDLSPLAGMKLETLEIGSTAVSDLSPLKGMPLTKLVLHDTPVSSLEPLEGMPLTHLQCNATRIASVSPLKGMSLTSLSIGDTRVIDLSPLEGMPLTSLSCQITPVLDLSPLTTMQLKELNFNAKPWHLKVVRMLTTLEQINGRPAKEFWKEFDQELPDP